MRALRELSPLLPRTHAEWLLLDETTPSNSLVIDAKFSAWNSREVLKVLGYLVNFGIRRGAIVFADRFPSREFDLELLHPQVARLRGKAAMGCDFWILALPPAPAHETGNAEALSVFVSDANLG